MPMRGSRAANPLNLVGPNSMPMRAPFACRFPPRLARIDLPQTPQHAKLFHDGRLATGFPALDVSDRRESAVGET